MMITGYCLAKRRQTVLQTERRVKIADQFRFQLRHVDARRNHVEIFDRRPVNRLLRTGAVPSVISS